MTLYCNECNTLVEELPASAEKRFFCPRCGKGKSHLEVHSIAGPICDAGPSNMLSYYASPELEYRPEISRYYVTFLVGRVMERLIVESTSFLDVIHELQQDYDLSEATDLHISLVTKYNK